MRRFIKQSFIIALALITVMLTGCGLKLSFKPNSSQVAVSTESSTEIEDKTTKDEVSTVSSNTEASTEKKLVDKSIEKATESVIEDSSTEVAEKEVDVFTEKYTYELPEDYVLLDDEFNTNTSKMYALFKRGKIVATIFMNYPDTKGYGEAEVKDAYKETILEKYDVILNSEIETNNFCWSGYYGKLKNEEGKSGYVIFDSTGDETVYLEFMCTDSYDCALDVATVLKSFKLNKVVE